MSFPHSMKLSSRTYIQGHLHLAMAPPLAPGFVVPPPWHSSLHLLRCSSLRCGQWGWGGCRCCWGMCVTWSWCKLLPEGRAEGWFQGVSEGAMVRASHRGWGVPAASLKEGAQGQALCQGQRRRGEQHTNPNAPEQVGQGGVTRKFFFLSSFDFIFPVHPTGPRKIRFCGEEGLNWGKKITFSVSVCV